MLQNTLKTAAMSLLLLSFQACSQTIRAGTQIKTDTYTRTSTQINTNIKQKSEKTYDEALYLPIIDSIQKTYKKQQYTYNRDHTSSRMFYRIIPIDLYPFFCVGVIPDKKLETIHLSKITYSIYKYTDATKNEYAQVGVESYTKNGDNLPTTKIYRLHSFFFNPIAKQWEIEKDPKTVTVDLTSSTEGTYGCRTIKK